MSAGSLVQTESVGWLFHSSILLNANLHCANFSACVRTSRIEPYAAHAGNGQEGNRSVTALRSSADPARLGGCY